MLRRIAAVVTLAVSLCAAGSACAADFPAYLPRYDLDIHIDCAAHRVYLNESATWTNPTKTPTSKVVLNVYPHFRLPPEDIGPLAKTLELLRLNPREGLDDGDRGHVKSVSLVEPGSPPVKLSFSFRGDNVTALEVPLPRSVGPGETVTLSIEYELELPQKQGRWGQWPSDPNCECEFSPDAVTQLATWLPTFAYYCDEGWNPTPFVPWHQPFFNEAGVYAARVKLPSNQLLACSAREKSNRDLGDGWRVIETVPIVSRDFALMCSAHYEKHLHTARLPDGREVEVCCYAFPEHNFYGREMARIAAEAIETYSRWIGPFPYPSFSIAETYFGWNGNECAGLIMIDQRVFSMPHLAMGYVEYLVSHETCHQWFYNTIGTNGYSETFVDEGFATYLTHRWMDRKLGKNNSMLKWPDRLEWLPNIERENYRWGSYHGTLRRGQSMPASAPLPEYGHLINLFGAAYDRGSKIIGMIEARLGEAAFVDFLHRLYERYYFRVLTAADLRRELEEYTGQSWEQFFQEWVYTGRLSDWKVQNVETAITVSGVRTVVDLGQLGEIGEQTYLGVSFEEGDGFPVRVPVIPNTDGPMEFDQPAAVVHPTGDGSVRVELLLPREPRQIAVDPDQVLPDSDPANNYWKPRINARFTPVYTQLDETDLTTDHDRLNFIYGPGGVSGTEVNGDPWYSRPIVIGAKAGLYRTQRYRASVFGGYRTDFRDVVIGSEGLIDHWPHPNIQLGYHYEYRVAGPIGLDGPDTANRAVLFSRYVITPTSSLYLPPIHYVEAFTTYQDNYLPFARLSSPGAQRPDRYITGGLHYRLDYRTPYWHPEGGFRIDAAYTGGGVNFDDWDSFQALRGEFAIAKRLPVECCYLADVVVAGRIGGAIAFPDRGQYFALGGGTIFRGFDFAERQGSRMWYASLEGRFPVLRDLQLDVLDHVAGLRNVYLAGFYDVGSISVADDQIEDVAHALGVGLRLDMSWFSLIERTMLRVDAAKTINAESPWQFWFGVQHPF